MTPKLALCLCLLSLSLTACTGGTVCPQNGFYSTTDEDITTNVQIKLANDRGLNDQDIHVRTYERVVTLSGSVANPTQRCVARILATSVAHVKKVILHLKIRRIQY